MAEKWGNHEAAFKQLEKDLKPYSSKEISTQVDAFKKSYKTCQGLEEKVRQMAVKARMNGVTGDGLSDFKRDSSFYDAYKALDREADDLAKAQKAAWIGSNYARAGVGDLKILIEHIEADLKKHGKELDEARDDLKKEQAKAKSGKGTISPATVKLIDTLEKELKKREPELKKLMAEIEKMKKDLTEAGGIYRKEVDQRMEDYLDKFDKMVLKLLGVAPKDGQKTEGLPTALQPNVLGVAVKKAVGQGKMIAKHLTAALDRAEKGGDPGVELKAARAILDQMKKAHKLVLANRKKFATQIKALKDDKELMKQFKLEEEAFETAEKAMMATAKKLASIR